MLVFSIAMLWGNSFKNRDLGIPIVLNIVSPWSKYQSGNNRDPG